MFSLCLWIAKYRNNHSSVPTVQMTKSSSISSDLKLWLILKYFAGIRLPFHFLQQPAEASCCSHVVYSVILIYAVFIKQARPVFRGGRFTALFTIIFTAKVSHVRYQLVSHLRESMKAEYNSEKCTKTLRLQKVRLIFS